MQHFLLPFLQPDGLPAYEHRKMHHLTWMQERTIELLMDQADLEKPSPPTEERVLHEPDSPVLRPPGFDEDPAGLEPGCIRLLSHRLTGASDRPTYVLTLGEWDPGWSWFVPFSSYSAPATNWELASGLDPNPLQALEIWNARSCPDHLLLRSWLVERVDVALVEDVKKVYAAFLHGEPVQAMPLSEKTGTRILHEEDPRRDYLAEETRLLDHLTGLALAAESTQGEVSTIPDNLVPFILEIERPRSELRLAAAPETSERPLQFYRLEIEGMDILLLLVELEAFPGSFTLTVERDEEGLLEGASIVDPEGVCMATIENGRAGPREAPIRFGEPGRIRLAIVLPDGSPLTIRRSNEGK